MMEIDTAQDKNMGRRGAGPSAEQSMREKLCAALSTVNSLSKELSSALSALNLARPPAAAGGVDFYDEVRRFETELILYALRETGGRQHRAAKLLGMKPTTLNHKIKVYNIDWKSLNATQA